MHALMQSDSEASVFSCLIVFLKFCCNQSLHLIAFNFGCKQTTYLGVKYFSCLVIVQCANSVRARTAREMHEDAFSTPIFSYFFMASADESCKC